MVGKKRENYLKTTTIKLQNSFVKENFLKIKDLKIDFAILRIFNLYGPKQEKKI